LLIARVVRSLVFYVVVMVGCSAKMASLANDDAGTGGVDGSAAPAPQCTKDSDCPTGHYCDAETCTLGCGSDDECGSGRSCCGHSCIPTDNDPANCGGCGITCAAGSGSAAGSAACCSATCTTLDSLGDCGACGNVCGSGDSCDGVQCNAPVYPSYCVNSQVYEMFDGIVGDIDAALLLSSTFGNNCSPATVVTSSSTSNAALVDQTTGEPLGGSGVTYVATGGPLADPIVKYLETTAAVTHVYLAEPTTGTYAWMQRGNPTPLATLQTSACSAHADQFVVEMVTDQTAGTLSLIGYGICTGEGTFGAAHFYADIMLAAPAMYPDAWYVVSWADTNDDGLANTGDTFTVLAHGN
jgi:Cys-rich repeat protein